MHLEEDYLGYSVFYPLHTEEYRGIVVLVHANQYLNPKSYGGLIESFLKNGLIVVYPVYERFLISTNRKNLEVLTSVISKAYDDIKINLPTFENLPTVYVGHSQGGIIVFQLAELSEKEFRKPAAVISVAPKEKRHHRLEDLDYASLEPSTTYLIIEENKDRNYKKEIGKEIHNKVKSFDRAYYVLHGNEEESYGHSGLIDVNKNYSSKYNGLKDYFSWYIGKKSDESRFYYKKINSAINCGIDRADCRIITKPMQPVPKPAEEKSKETKENLSK